MGLAEINSAVSQLDQVTQQNAAMVEESTAASHTLRQDADQLGQLVRHFHTSASSGAKSPAPKKSGRNSSSVTAQQERVRAFATQGSAALKNDPEPELSDDDWYEF